MAITIEHPVSINEFVLYEGHRKDKIDSQGAISKNNVYTIVASGVYGALIKGKLFIKPLKAGDTISNPEIVIRDTGEH